LPLKIFPQANGFLDTNTGSNYRLDLLTALANFLLGSHFGDLLKN
jgi:hypothetical protein